MKTNAIIIIGGGLAGLTSAIHLSKLGLPVTLIEKNKYPKHKVCGEYISNEIIPYFISLGLNVSDLNPESIEKLQFSTTKGKTINANLPLGGFGISRYALDEFLYNKAISNGCEILEETVETIRFKENQFTITTFNATILKAEIVIGAFGKRSNVDQELDRKFIKQKSSWLAVKAHYSGNFANNIVGLHNFEGGYCGISKVENGIVNVCYLADYITFKKHKNIEDYQRKVLCENPHLKSFFKNATLLFEKPLTISQISFDKKKTVENHILMIGDSAGLIHPLCGNGMAMAIHAAKIVSETVEKYFSKKINSRAALEKEYTKQWNFNFSKRLYTGRVLAYVLQNQKLTSFLMHLLIIFPFLLPKIIKSTHGKPIILK